MRRIATGKQAFDSWKSGKYGGELILSAEQIIKCVVFFDKVVANKAIIPQKYREHLMEFVIYDVPGDWFELTCSRKNSRNFTKEYCEKFYGPIEGMIRWDTYCSKQAVTNTFAYKSKKYGMSKEKFQEYNKSRAITLETMILKYGESNGTKKFTEYCEKQKTAGVSESYFISKYGEAQGKEKFIEVCKSKGLTLPNFIKKYGEEEGTKKFTEYYQNVVCPFYSTSSQNLFWALYKQISYLSDHIYFAELNKEFGAYDGETNTYKMYDFVMTDIKLVIEYDGDHYHGHPEIYIGTDKLKGRGMGKTTAIQAWEKDKHKTLIMENKGYKVFRVWDSEYIKSPVKVVKRFVKLIKNEFTKNQ